MMTFIRTLFLIFIIVPSFLYAGGSSDEKDHSPKYPTKKSCPKRKQSTTESKDLPQLNYLAYAAHEIKNQLGGLEALNFVKTEHLDKDDLEYLEMAQSSAKATLSLVKNILSASSLEAGQLKLSREKLNPFLVAEETMKQLAFEASQKGIKLELSTPLESDIYLGDPTRLGEIFFNLVHNAIKFTNEGSVRLVLLGISERERFILQGDVIDTGRGIPLEIQDTLFKPFSHPTTLKQHPGNGVGLGLFITKELCSLMGGEIKVKSQEGKGSTFLFKVALEYVDD